MSASETFVFLNASLVGIDAMYATVTTTLTSGGLASATVLSDTIAVEHAAPLTPVDPLLVTVKNGTLAVGCRVHCHRCW